MKVLYVAMYTSAAFREDHRDPSSPSFGGLRKIELVSAALMGAGHEVLLLSSGMVSASRWNVRGAEEERLDVGSGSVRVIYPAALELRPLGGLLSALRARGIVDRVVRDFRPDVVLAYNTYLYEYLATTGLVARNQIPVFVEVEDLPLARSREWGNLKPRLDQACWAPMLRRAAGFTAVNDAILKMLPPGKPSLLLPGIIDDQLRTMVGERPRAFGGERRTLGYFGGLTRDKGVGILLELAPLLPEPWDIVVTGGGPLASQFEEAQARHPGRVRFLGTVPPKELYRQMCLCDCTFVPPERISGGGEGVFPFKLFEYVVAGTHVIAPRLKPLEGSPLHFAQRWDGRVESVPDLLLGAERDYLAETGLREAVSAEILSRYSVRGVGALMSELLQGG